MRSRIDRAVERIAFWTAMLGGVALIAVLVLTVVSIIGRSLIFAGLGPIPGDFELVEAGTAFAVLTFLPLCQFHRGHVTVDLFLSRAGRRPNAVIDVISNLLMTGAAAVLTWRLYDGMLDKRSYGETTFILQFPVWWGYAASLLGAAAFTLVCAYTVVRSLRETRTTHGARKISER
ncbi:TRAP transporter small permease [Pelagibius marinus]|uniref:TRAP transporter small permease n=1 Tax=Pelagibius marinus TaxID=2762760 RepID=UPI00187255EF|nr:TRAP transporter small permease [Pelagibius marinus]